MSRTKSLPQPWDKIMPLVGAFNFELIPDSRHYKPEIADIENSGFLSVLLASPRGRKCLAADLQNLTGKPEPELCFDFDAPWARLALLDQNTLLRLADFLGLAIFRKRVALCIWGDCVMYLKNSFGVDGYNFALKKAAFFPDKLIDGLRDVFGRIFPSPESTQQLATQIRSCGSLGLLLNFSQAPVGLKQRLQLKLPPDFGQEVLSNFEPDGKTVFMIRSLLQMILLKEVAPQCKNFMS